MDPDYATAAWNGIKLDIPHDWVVRRIGLRHLVFETRSDAVMEIKWQPIKGKFSAGSHLKRLARGQGGSFKKALRPWPLPDPWRSALQRFDANGFRWQTRDTGGRGVMLFCPICQTASLIQFLRPMDEDERSRASDILSGYSDHRTDDRVLWSLFDIRICLSADFKLQDFGFHPGRYELTFQKGSTSLCVMRWAPAGSLLAHQSLAEFGARTLDRLVDADIMPSEYQDHPAVVWRQGTPKRRFAHRFRSRSLFHQARIWHIRSKNRILGLHLWDTRPLDNHLLDDLCASYEIC